MALRLNIKTVLHRLHTVIILSWTMLGTAIFGIIAIGVSLRSQTGDGVHLVGRVWGRSILWVSGIRLIISGLDAAQSERACIYMANHQSNFDIPVLLGGLPVQFRWLAKAELFKIPIFGRSMRGAGYISIDRSDRVAAFASLERAAATIRSGTSVMIFPEGTRSLDGVLLPFKKGPFVLAVDSGVPIVPITLCGTHAMMPKGRWLIRRRDVQVNFLTPIETLGYTRKTKELLMDRVRTSMLDDLSCGNCGGRDA